MASRKCGKRALVGLGTGRESAKIRYWLTNQEGKKVFEHDDTIRTEFYASAYSASVGQLGGQDRWTACRGEVGVVLRRRASAGSSANSERELRKVAPSFT